MLTTAAILLIIAVLYFIDKYHLWKKAALVCLITLAVAVVGAGGYYGWQYGREWWQERKAQKARWKVVDVWNLSFVSEDVASAILDPVKANETAKAEAWTWYHRSRCGYVVGKRQVIVHDTDLFGLDSYDERWLKEVDLAEETKRALWSAKARECQLPPGSRNVTACLDRQTGTVSRDPFSDYGGHLISCGPKQEMVYLNSESEAKK